MWAIPQAWLIIFAVQRLLRPAMHTVVFGSFLNEQYKVILINKKDPLMA